MIPLFLSCTSWGTFLTLHKILCFLIIFIILNFLSEMLASLPSSLSYSLYLSKLVLDYSLVNWICYFIINWYLVFQFFFFFNYAKSKIDPIFKILLNICLYFWLCFSNKCPSFTTSLMFSSCWRMFSKFYLLKKKIVLTIWKEEICLGLGGLPYL